MRHFNIALTAFTIANLLSGNAFAHSTLVKETAAEDSYYTAQIQIPHGCNGEATNKVSIKFPEGFISAKPMPKAGWNIDIVKGKVIPPKIRCVQK